MRAWRKRTLMSPDGARTLIQDYLKSRAVEGPLRAFVIRHVGDDKLLGIVQVETILGDVGLLGIWVGADARRQGIGRTAVHLVCRYAFGMAGLRKVRADIADWNEPSKELARSARLEELVAGAAGKPVWSYFGVTAEKWAERRRAPSRPGGSES